MAARAPPLPDCGSAQGGGGAHETGKRRGFRQRHLAGGFAEIFQRRRLYAIGSCTEIDAVHIEFEDLVLAVGPFQPERDDGFLALAADGPLRIEVDILRKLLGDVEPPCSS